MMNMSLDTTIVPEGYPFDPITQVGAWSSPTQGVAFGNGAPVIQQDQVHGKSGGYLPAWLWVPPPGIGDAPQHVYSTFSLYPLSVDGPGDRPASFFRSILPPVIQAFAMRWQGMAVDGGSLLMTGLYTPDQLASPGNDLFAGS